MLEEFIYNGMIDSFVDKQIDNHYDNLKPMPIIIEKGSATSVDWTKYELTTEQAAHELFEGRDVMAREFEDFFEEDSFSFPEVMKLSSTDFIGSSVEDIIESIREYERFGRASIGG